MSTCRSCGASLLWALTPQDKKMPLDPGEVYVEEGAEWPRGLQKIVSDEEPARCAPAIELVDRAPEGSSGPFFANHWGSCDAPDRFRR